MITRIRTWWREHSSHQTARRFYVAGCQRTGTTLMRLILESHPDIACMDEDRSYALLPSLNRRRGQHVVGRCKKPLVGFKIPRFTEQLLDLSMDDPDFGSFLNPYAGEPIVFLHRDARDVVASMMSLTYPDGLSWMERYGRRVLAYKSGQSGFASRYGSLVEKVAHLGNRPHAVGALYWRYKSEAFLQYQERRLPLLAVCYERLVADPASEMRRVLTFLGVAWDDCVLAHPLASHGELDKDGLAIGNTDPSRPIDGSSVGRFTERLTQQEIADIGEIVGSSVDRLRDAIVET
jgi:hypothetical protein